MIETSSRSQPERNLAAVSGTVTLAEKAYSQRLAGAGSLLFNLWD